MKKSEKKTNIKKELLYLLAAVVGSFAVFVLIFCIIAHDDIEGQGTFDEVKDTVNDVTNTVTGNVTDDEPPYSDALVSSTYLVGYDYFTGDFLEMAPTVIAKVRYDGKIETEFRHTLSNGEEFTDVVLFDLSDEQYKNIEEAINLRKLYNLNPQEADPETTMDGGTSWLIIYKNDGTVYKACGGFCPHNSDFNAMRRAVYENLPEEFFEYCSRYKETWIRENNFEPYAGHSEQYYTTYGVFLNYDGDLKELSDYNYIVIDAQYHSEDEIRDFQYLRYLNRVYSYINIGSLEDFRDYYDRFSDITLGAYENWDGEEWVDVSDERWQDFILNELAPELLAKGINGFFVDNCDVYYNYPSEEILNGLATIMKGLKQMGVEVIINGGDAFLDAYTEKIGPWTDVISGINQECVFTGIDWDEETFVTAADEDKKYFTEYIEKYASQGAYIYLIEYAYDDRKYWGTIYDIKEYCIDNNFLYYISDSIDLD